MNTFTLLFLVLLVLKLVGTVTISWWGVFAPLLIALAIFISLFVIPSIFIWRK